ncbi:MAG: class I SAM-dependent methyltransferase [Gaiellaceae bacterium]
MLQSESELRIARQELRRRGLSHLGSLPLRWSRRIRRKLGLKAGVDVGDAIKSWDVWTAAQFLEARARHDTPILDIGAYASEILCVLHRLGFTSLSGVDLDPRITNMPYAGQIQYRVSDFMHTPFADQSFGAITAISVIEHGFQSEALLAEISRLLRPGGTFIASFDYWPEKIDTRGVRLFGMDWRIFSRDEVMTFLDDAGRHGLHPCGEIHLEAETPPVHWSGRRYTFALLVLQKDA